MLDAQRLLQPQFVGHKASSVLLLIYPRCLSFLIQVNRWGPNLRPRFKSLLGPTCGNRWLRDWLASGFSPSSYESQQDVCAGEASSLYCGISHGPIAADIDCPDWGHSSFFSVPPYECRNNYLKYVRTDSFHILPNSSSYHLTPSVNKSYKIIINTRGLCL